MRKYRIEGGRYGGEVTIGSVPAVLLESNPDVLDMEEDELIDFFMDNEELVGSAWYEIDDKEHLCGPYADSPFTVTEIVDGMDDWDFGEETTVEEAAHIYGREAYTFSGNENLTEDKTVVPILTMHSAEKGCHGVWFLETEEEFDPEKLAYSTLETDVGEFVENVFYDRKPLESNFDYADTNGKGMYSSIGNMVLEWWDRSEIYTEEYIEEIFEWNQ